MEEEIILESEELSYDLGYSGDRTMGYAIDEEYYLFIDKYGAFLHTYDGGEDGEVTVIVFKN